MVQAVIIFVRGFGLYSQSRYTSLDNSRVEIAIAARSGSGKGNSTLTRI